MYLPIRRWRAVVIGMAIVLASHADSGLWAGVVVPLTPTPNPAPLSNAATTAYDAASPAPASALPADADVDSAGDVFWYPGTDSVAANLDQVSLSAVPVVAPSVLPADSPLPGTQQHPLIPLPGAAWTGMAGLLGLGAVKLLKNFRRLLA